MSIGSFSFFVFLFQISSVLLVTSTTTSYADLSVWKGCVELLCKPNPDIFNCSDSSKFKNKQLDLLCDTVHICLI